MKRFTQTTLALSITATTLATATFASKSDASDWLSVSGNVSIDIKGSKNGDWEKNLRTQDAELKFEIAIREGIKAVIKTELERTLMVDGKGVSSQKFDVEKFVEEAYIQIQTDKALGMPRALVTLGKHSMAFGAKLSQMPMFKDNLLHKVGKESEVIGVTVVLEPKFMKIVDEVAVSVFEAGAGDLDIAKKSGGSMTLGKKITKQIQAKVSLLYKQSLDPSMDDEKRAALGFVWNSQDGNWTIWTEGILFKHNPVYPDSEMAATTGLSRKLGPGSIVVEYSYVENFAQEIGTAYNLPVGKNLVISPEVRYRFEKADKSEDDVIVGVRARVFFKAQETKRTLLKGAK